MRGPSSPEACRAAHAMIDHVLGIDRENSLKSHVEMDVRLLADGSSGMGASA